MKTLLIGLLFATLTDGSIYDFKVPSLDGNDIDFSQYKGKKILIVNTASKCGNTRNTANWKNYMKSIKINSS